MKLVWAVNPLKAIIKGRKSEKKDMHDLPWGRIIHSLLCMSPSSFFTNIDFICMQ